MIYYIYHTRWNRDNWKSCLLLSAISAFRACMILSFTEDPTERFQGLNWNLKFRINRLSWKSRGDLEIITDLSGAISASRVSTIFSVDFGSWLGASPLDWILRRPRRSPTPSSWYRTLQISDNFQYRPSFFMIICHYHARSSGRDQR